MQNCASQFKHARIFISETSRQLFHRVIRRSNGAIFTLRITGSYCTFVSFISTGRRPRRCLFLHDAIYTKYPWLIETHVHARVSILGSDTNIWPGSIADEVDGFSNIVGGPRRGVNCKLNKAMSVAGQRGSSGAFPSFSSTRRKFLTLSIRLDAATADLSRESTPNGSCSVDIDRYSALSVDSVSSFSLTLSVCRAFFFIFYPLDTSDAGLIIGNEETRLITDDSSWTAGMKIWSRRNSREIGLAS